MNLEGFGWIWKDLDGFGWIRGLYPVFSGVMVNSRLKRQGRFRSRFPRDFDGSDGAQRCEEEVGSKEPESFAIIFYCIMSRQGIPVPGDKIYAYSQVEGQLHTLI